MPSFCWHGWKRPRTGWRRRLRKKWWTASTSNGQLGSASILYRALSEFAHNLVRQIESTCTRHIHLHVISEDFESPCVKTKKHYNSFRRKLDYFLPLEEVLEWFEEDTMQSYFEDVCASFLFAESLWQNINRKSNCERKIISRIWRSRWCASTAFVKLGTCPSWKGTCTKSFWRCRRGEDVRWSESNDARLPRNKSLRLQIRRGILLKSKMANLSNVQSRGICALFEGEIIWSDGRRSVLRRNWSLRLAQCIAGCEVVR